MVPRASATVVRVILAILPVCSGYHTRVFVWHSADEVEKIFRFIGLLDVIFWEVAIQVLHFFPKRMPAFFFFSYLILCDFILDIIPLLVFTNSFSHSLTFLFTLLMAPFWCKPSSLSFHMVIEKFLIYL